MGNPVSSLARRLRNGKRAGAAPMTPEATQATGAGRSEEIWIDGEVFREIWDNDEDAIYDDPPGVRAILG